MASTPSPAPSPSPSPSLEEASPEEASPEEASMAETPAEDPSTLSAILRAYHKRLEDAQVEEPAQFDWTIKMKHGFRTTFITLDPHESIVLLKAKLLGALKDPGIKMFNDDDWVPDTPGEVYFGLPMDEEVWGLGWALVNDPTINSSVNIAELDEEELTLNKIFNATEPKSGVAYQFVKAGQACPDFYVELPGTSASQQTGSQPPLRRLTNGHNHVKAEPGESEVNGDS
ncbi:MAG: hypothetical protein M1829_003431 [Trizodia sp. TS-e1964]|nr:MAG: hypothetical protein M1829_003431 [Trizodia sp. TS-e1964]